ncbi:rRNA maturation RNase YbeY [Flavobacterium sp.]|uniref:rRNA maturation RNase YbeY n=1 Tax=Flavobacterium sp. TaxID=239 RepID=UPI00286E4B39|nr:rRNA maturation RNase YbeY [Flavobacterium sp.]
MISFNYELDFEIPNEEQYSCWISNVILSEEKSEGEINYIFCDDDYLLDLNQKHLNHDTLTDIISFDYSLGKEIHGDVYISIERVRENAEDFKVSFDEELRRVMIHGILHYCGFKDKTVSDEQLMRTKEDEKIKMFHVKQN